MGEAENQSEQLLLGMVERSHPQIPCANLLSDGGENGTSIHFEVSRALRKPSDEVLGEAAILGYAILIGGGLVIASRYIKRHLG